MKILHIMPSFTLDSGYLSAILPLSRHLVALGHSVEIVSGEDSKKSKIGGMRTFPVTFPRAWYRAPLLDDWLKKNAGGYDIFHLHGLWDYPQCRAAQYANKSDIPYIISPHGIFVGTHRNKSLKKRIYLRMIGNRMLRLARAIHVTSELELKGCQTAGIRNEIVEIPWGVDPSGYSSEPEPSNAESLWPELAGRRILLFMSRLSPEKGLDELLRALASVKEDHRSVLLVIAGEEGKKRKFRKMLGNLVEKLGLEPHVLFSGLVDGPAKRALLRRADILVMPSYGENFSFAIAEALACGVPVIASTRTPWPEIQDIDAGRYVDPTPGALRAAIHELLSMPPQELRKMGLRGKQLIGERYRWPDISNKFAELYGRFVKNAC